MLCDPAQYFKIGLVVLYYCFQSFIYDYDPLIFSGLVGIKMYNFFPPTQKSGNQDLLLPSVLQASFCNAILYLVIKAIHCYFDVFWKSMVCFRNAVKKESGFLPMCRVVGNFLHRLNVMNIPSEWEGN